MNSSQLYEQWLKKATGDPDLICELQAIENNEDEIYERFYRALEFGTAGLRGLIGAGTNRMNIYTVGRTTQGFADYLNKNYENPSVAIGYDSRIKSEYFSREAASVLAANGIKVYMYDELQPTPCLSFAVRKFGTSGGIILTASHNPAKYNGYKCYNSKGYQMTDDEAKETYNYIERLDYFKSIKKTDFDEAVKKGLIEYMGSDIIEKYLDAVETQCVHQNICSRAELNVIFTPLNGAGNKPVRKILKRIGVSNVRVVEKQKLPDGNFPTCPFPNPEIKQVFELAIKMNEKEHADLLLATDPDCDRVGIAIPKSNGEVRLMSGNEVGILLLNYLLQSKKENKTLSDNHIVFKSFVSTNMAEAVAAKYNCKLKNLLTGFKYIGEQITDLEKDGKENNFVIGFEESYGYLAGTHARDKDAVVASMLICEMAAYYKEKGMSLDMVMNSLYEEFGYYLNIVENYAFEGAAGMKKMDDIMESMRKNPPSSLAGLTVKTVCDYKTSTSTDILTGNVTPITLPSSNVLEYKLEGENKLIVRPSGTEPKIKAYITAIDNNNENAAALAEKLILEANALMEV